MPWPAVSPEVMLAGNTTLPECLGQSAGTCDPLGCAAAARSGVFAPKYDATAPYADERMGQLVSKSLVAVRTLRRVGSPLLGELA